MAHLWFKNPDELEIPGENFANRLASGDSVASATCEVFDKDGVDVSGNMIDGSPIITDEDGDSLNDTVSIKIKNGTAGQWYRLKILATTANGEKKEADIFIKVREESIS